MTTAIPTRKHRPLWEEFYRLDQADESAIQRFIRERRVVELSAGVFPKSVRWDLSGRTMPTEADLTSPDDIRSSQRAFVQHAEFMFNWLSQRQPPTRDHMNILVDFNWELGQVHPRLVLKDDRSFGIEVPGSSAPYTTLGGIYLSLAQDLARGVVARCPQCQKLFSVTPKQTAKLRQGKRAYCSDTCRIAYIESSDERRAQKVAAARKSRKEKQRVRKRSTKSKTGG